MTAIITLASAAKLTGAPYTYLLFTARTDDDALDQFKAALKRRKLNEGYETTGYRIGNRVFFVMDYGRVHEARQTD